MDVASVTLWVGWKIWVAEMKPCPLDGLSLSQAQNPLTTPAELFTYQQQKL